MADLEGLSETVDALGRLATDGRAAVKQEMGRQAHALLLEAQRRVPVRTGKLRDSGRVREWKNGWNVIFEAEYAQFQHDNLRFRHRRGGQAKFLEGPFEQMYFGMFEAQQEALNRWIDGSQ